MSDTTKLTGWLRAMAAMDEADEPAITSPHRVAADYIDDQQNRIDDLHKELTETKKRGGVTISSVGEAARRSKEKQQ